jgi:hypothetical protein
VSDLYERLGVDSSASPEELKRAYRQRARELHPDVNRDDADGRAMRRLNEAWAVLGDPDTRRHYDADRAAAQGASTARHAGPEGPPPDVAAGMSPPRQDSGTPGPRTQARPTVDADIFPERISLGWWRIFRPSVLIPIVLLLIFVITAYAAHPGSGGAPAAPSKSTTSGATAIPGAATLPGSGNDTATTAGPNLVGSCIRNQPTSVQLVPCSEPPNSLVVAAVPATATCPAGTEGFSLAGQSEMVCATSSIP